MSDIYVNDNYGDPNSIYTLALGNDTIKCYDCVDMNYYNRKFATIFLPRSRLGKKDFSQVVTLERNWNLSTIPQPDGSGEGWDQWWRPFGSLRGTHDDICGFAPCSEYYDGKTPARSDSNWNDQGLYEG